MLPFSSPAMRAGSLLPVPRITITHPANPRITPKIFDEDIFSLSMHDAIRTMKIGFAFIRMLEEVAVVYMREAKTSMLNMKMPVKERNKNIFQSFFKASATWFDRFPITASRKMDAKKHLSKLITNGCTSPFSITTRPTKKTLPHMAEASVPKI